MATTPKRPLYLHLSCDVQLYAWGKVGLESEVALLKSSAEPGSFTVNEEQTYAEVRTNIVAIYRRLKFLLLLLLLLLI